jgi:hypothetical protein
MPSSFIAMRYSFVASSSSFTGLRSYKAACRRERQFQPHPNALCPWFHPPLANSNPLQAQGVTFFHPQCPNLRKQTQFDPMLKRATKGRIVLVHTWNLMPLTSLRIRKMIASTMFLGLARGRPVSLGGSSSKIRGAMRFHSSSETSQMVGKGSFSSSFFL